MVEVVITLLISGILFLGVICISTLMVRNKKEQRKSDSKIGGSLLKFLNIANTEYMRAQETCKLEYFSRFCTRRLCDQLSSLVHADSDLPLYSQRAYSFCEWSVIEEEGNSLVIEKFIRFRDIRVNGARVKVSEDTREIWKVECTNNKYLVSSII